MTRTKMHMTALLATQAVMLGFFPVAGLAATFRLEEATVADINAAFDAGALSSTQLTQLYLNRIDAYDNNGPSINSLITINPNALQTAAKLDAERQLTGPRSPLHGIPVLLKDNYDTFDLPTTAGSLSLEGSIPPDDAFVVEKLREAGALVLGKTNLDEFARGSSGLSSLGGQTRNPYALDRVPGGSSAGTGASVAANFATVGLGTETGVSIRNPAANNSLVGIAPTQGLVSRDGIIPISFTQDRAGPLARSVADAAAVLSVVAGFDPADSVTANSIGKIPTEGYTSFLDKDSLSGARIGVLRDLFRSGAEHQESIALIETAIEDMRKQGAVIVDPVTTGLDLFETLSTARVNNFEFKFALNDYLASLVSTAPVKSLEEIIESGEYLPSLKPGLVSSQSVESLDDNPEYESRLMTREFLRQLTLDLMETNNLDALVYPMKSRPAPLIGTTDDMSDNPFSSITGLPAITIPAGFTDDGLPTGIEFLGKSFSEPTLISLAYSYEQATMNRLSPTTTPPLPGEVFEYEPVPESSSTIALTLFGLGALGLKLKQHCKIKSESSSIM